MLVIGWEFVQTAAAGLMKEIYADAVEAAEAMVLKMMKKKMTSIP